MLTTHNPNILCPIFVDLNHNNKKWNFLYSPTVVTSCFCFNNDLYETVYPVEGDVGQDLINK